MKPTKREKTYIQIADDWYLSTDGLSFLLLKRRVITDPAKAKKDNIGKATYETMGYFSSLSSLAAGLVRYMSMEVLAKGGAATLKDYVKQLDERIDAIKQLDMALVERIKQQMGVCNE